MLDFNPTEILQYHRFLIADTRERLDRYRQAIDRTVRDGDFVLDLGAGTGILSLLACRAGARMVLAVEASPAADLADVVIAANAVRDRIAILNESSFQADPVERANLLVTDTFGTFGLQSGGLMAVLDARRRLLTAQARLIPRALELWITPVEQPDFYHRTIDAWANSVHGMNVSALRSFAVNNLHSIRVDRTAFLANPVPLARVDLSELTDPAVEGDVTVEVRREGVVHGICGWFAAELADGVAVDNAPGGTTNYAQTFFPIETPSHVEKGDRMKVSIQHYDMAEVRWQIEISGSEERGATRQVTFDHSTFWGFPLGKERIHRLSQYYAPTRSRRGDAERFALDLFDGQHCIDEVARRLADRFRDEFPSPDEASAFVKRVAEQCA